MSKTNQNRRKKRNRRRERWMRLFFKHTYPDPNPTTLDQFIKMIEAPEVDKSLLEVYEFYRHAFNQQIGWEWWSHHVIPIVPLQ